MAVAAVLSFSPVSVFAESKELKVGATAGAVYDSNLFFNNADRQADLALTASPNVLYQKNFKKTQFVLNASPTFLSYVDHGDLNAVNYRLTEALTHQLDRHWQIQLRNNNVRDSVSYLTGSDLGATGRFQYDYNSLSPTVTWKSGRGTELVSSYTFDSIRYDEDSIGDSLGHQFSEGWTQRLDEHFSMLADVGYQWRSFNNDIEANILLMDLGLLHRPTRRLSHEIRLGLQVSDQTAADTATGFYYDYRLNYELTRRTDFIFSSGKTSSIIQSQNNVLDLWQTSVSLSHALTRMDRLQGSVTYLRATDSTLNGSDDFYKYDMSWLHTFSRYWSAKLGYSYEDKVTDVSLPYDRHTVYANAEYQF